MSFASEIKNELTRVESNACCLYSELSALIRMNGVLSFSQQKMTLDIPTENAAIARRIYSLIKEIYPIPIELLVRKKMKLKKNNVYIVRMNTKVKELLQDLDIYKEGYGFYQHISKDMMKDVCCKRAYLRGAFLAGGSINNPETSSYHLEIFNIYKEHNESLCELMNTFGLSAKQLQRRNGYIVYLKEAEKITELLNIIGAHNALFKFEDVRIVRDMKNSVNRLVNCETANINKTISAAFKQMENIRLIERTIGLDALPMKLQEVAITRKNHEEASLKELGELIPSGKISKSGINHRMKKIEEIADKIQKGTMST